MSTGSRHRRLRGCSVVLLLLVVVGVRRGLTQQPVPPAEGREAMVQLNFGDTVDLRVFVDYVAARTGRNFIYDESLVGAVTLRAPTEVPVTALYGVLESVLEFKGWSLVAAPEGFIKVVPAGVAATKPTPFFGPEEMGKLPDADVIVTQVVKLKYAEPAAVLASLQPILSGTSVTGRPTLRVPTAARRPTAARPAFPTATTALGGRMVAVPEHRLIIITDYAPNVRRIVRLIQTLDREAPAAEMDLIPLQYIRAEEYAPKILNYLQARYGQAGRPVPVAPLVDYDSRLNTLIVVASADDLDAVHALIADLDVEVPEEARRYRIIRLKNSSAEEMLATLQEVMAAQAQGPTGARLTTGPKPPPRAPGAPGPAAPGASTAGRGGSPISGTRVTAIADKHTNAIILIGPREEQEVLAAIIESLDTRRPQVLIEALIVEVDTDRILDIGLELAHLQPLRGTRVGGVSTFGFTTANITGGTVEIAPAAGLTGFLILDSQVTALLNLFQQKGLGKIVSRPRALVNDNESATFISEREEPFIQVSNLGADTTTVSFGGYEKAGTTLEITPHISEADYLQLEIRLVLSAFQGEGTVNAPPPRVTNNVYSKVTVPDNRTVLLGGLTRTDERKTVQKVPLLGDLPLLGWLFRRDTVTKSEATLYVFIKSRIAREEDFSDLQALAEEASQTLLQQENLLRDPAEQVPTDEDVYQSPAFRPEIEP